VRPRRRWVGWLEQCQLAAYRSSGQIQLHDLRGVPQRNKAARPIVRDRQGNGIRGGNGIVLGQVEALDDSAAGGIQQQNIVGEIVGNQQLLRARLANNGNRRRKGTPLSPSTPPGSLVLRPAASGWSGRCRTRSGVIWPPAKR